jgi:hypothetical protein
VLTAPALALSAAGGTYAAVLAPPEAPLYAFAVAFALLLLGVIEITMLSVAFRYLCGPRVHVPA